MKGRATLTIVHRLSPLRSAHRLVVLNGGKGDEVGTHAELLERKGEFQPFVELQRELWKLRAVARRGRGPS